jgi:hypothetical protein
MTANHTFEILGPVCGSLMRRTPSHLGQLDSCARIAEESILHPSNSGGRANISHPCTGQPIPSAPIQPKSIYIPQTIRAGGACNHDHLRHVAGTHATNDGSLGALQKAPHPPFHS